MMTMSKKSMVTLIGVAVKKMYLLNGNRYLLSYVDSVPTTTLVVPLVTISIFDFVMIH